MTCAWSTLEWCGSFDPEVSLTIFMGCPCSAADYIIYVRSPMDSSQFWNEELYTLTQKIMEVENAEFSHFFEGGASVLDSTSFWDFQTQGGWPWHEMSSGLYQRFRGELCKLSGKYRGSIPLLEGSLIKQGISLRCRISGKQDKVVMCRISGELRREFLVCYMLFCEGIFNIVKHCELWSIMT